MIKNLSGDYETVEYENKRFVMLYDNIETENYPIHWHNAVEIIMPLRNSYVVITGGKTFQLNERDIIIIPPGELHTLPPHEGRRLIFQCDNDVLTKTPALNNVLPAFSSALLITPDTDKKMHSVVQQAMLDIYSEYFSPSALSDTKMYMSVVNIMLAVRDYQLRQQASAIENEDEKLLKYSDKFSHVLRYIDRNYMYDVSLDTLADIAGYSKYHFSRMFKQFSSVSYVQYINRKRIKAAELLLLDPSLPITEVAIRSGFSSLTTFNRTFKEVKNCTPSEFKKLYKSANENE